MLLLLLKCQYNPVLATNMLVYRHFIIFAFICGLRCKWWSHRQKLTLPVISIYQISINQISDVINLPFTLMNMYCCIYRLPFYIHISLFVNSVQVLTLTLRYLHVCEQYTRYSLMLYTSAYEPVMTSFQRVIADTDGLLIVSLSILCINIEELVFRPMCQDSFKTFCGCRVLPGPKWI